MEKKYTKADKYQDIETILGQIETEDFDIPTLIEFVQGERAALARKAAKAKDVKISCDLNYRGKLWSRAEAREAMTKLCEYVDVVYVPNFFI